MLDGIDDHVGILWKDEVYNTVHPTIGSGVASLHNNPTMKLIGFANHFVSSKVTNRVNRRYSVYKQRIDGCRFGARFVAR